MSLTGKIIGFPSLEIERVVRKNGIWVWAKPSCRPNCLYCKSADLRIKATYQRTVKHTRQCNQVMTMYLRVPKYHCRQCGRYFRYRFSGILPRYRASEAFKLEVFEAHDGGVTQRKLARSHGIGTATIERWYQRQISLRYSEIRTRNCPLVLGIDEHFFSRKAGFATTFVDLKNHRVFDVKLGRSEASLRSYLRSLKGRDRVRVVVMDLSDPYRAIARRYFPNARIVADRFHVVRLVNQHFMKLWSQHDPEGRKNRGLISLMRRHQWHLRDEQQANLMEYLNDYPVLKALYIVKQKLNRYILLKTLTKKRARRHLRHYLALVAQLKESPLRKLAATLERWMEPIIAMWRFSKNNGITEGFHTKMEMMTRRAYGFRNFENYRLRVLAHCGWDGIIKRPI